MLQTVDRLKKGLEAESKDRHTDRHSLKHTHSYIYAHTFIYSHTHTFTHNSPENSFHSLRFTYTPGSLQIICMHTSPPYIKDSCFIEDSQRMPSSKRAITLRFWEKAFFLLLYPQGTQTQTDLIQKPTPSTLLIF